MIADLYVYELGDVMLLTLAGDVKDAVLAKLDQFIFSEDVQLGDVTETFAQIAVVGPDAARAVAAVARRRVGRRAARRCPSTATCAPSGPAAPAIVARVTDTGEPGFDLFVDACAARTR